MAGVGLTGGRVTDVGSLGLDFTASALQTQMHKGRREPTDSRCGPLITPEFMQR